MHKLFLGFFALTIFTLSSSTAEEHSPWEMGLSLGYASLPDENAEGMNIHLHLSKRLEYEDWRKYLSVGLGFESIISDETHYATMLTLGIHPIEDLTFAISPSLEFAKHHDSWEQNYATHLELSYVFDVSEDFHLGPVISYSHSNEGEHYTVGVHLGMPF